MVQQTAAALVVLFSTLAAVEPATPRAVRSGRSVMAAEPQATQSIPIPASLVPEPTPGNPASQTSRLRRALTDPLLQLDARTKSYHRLQ